MEKKKTRNEKEKKTPEENSHGKRGHCMCILLKFQTITAYSPHKVDNENASVLCWPGHGS